MMEFMKYLQGWLAIAGLMAIGNTMSFFTDHRFLSDKIYTLYPTYVNPLLARVFGIWTLLNALLRIYCAVQITNTQVYNLTMASFLLILVHFSLEVFIYKTAAVSVGILIQFLVSGLSFVAMLVGYWLKSAVENAGNSVRSRRSMREELLLAQKNS